MLKLYAVNSICIGNIHRYIAKRTKGFLSKLKRSQSKIRAIILSKFVKTKTEAMKIACSYYCQRVRVKTSI